MTFEEWKLQYRHRVAMMGGVKPECFAETIHMIPDDLILRECWIEGENPNEAADEMMAEEGE